jgi:hypothetical protein
MTSSGSETTVPSASSLSSYPSRPVRTYTASAFAVSAKRMPGTSATTSPAMTAATQARAAPSRSTNARTSALASKTAVVGIAIRSDQVFGLGSIGWQRHSASQLVEPSHEFARVRTGEVSLEDREDLRIDGTAFGSGALPQALVQLIRETKVECRHPSMISERYQDARCDSVVASNFRDGARAATSAR